MAKKIKYNWIVARCISNGKILKVRCQSAGSRVWLDEDCNIYLFVDLDFTIVPNEE